MGLAPTASTTAHLAVGDALAVCLMEWKSFGKEDFRKFHPGGSLGQRLSRCIDEIMHTENIPVVPADSSLAQALNVLNRGGLGLVALTDDQGRLHGVFTDGDVRRLVCRGPFDPEDRVEGFMTASPKRARTGDRAARVLDIMEQNEITVMPVVREDDVLAGLVHLHDLLGKGSLRFSSNGHANGGAG